jgi:hypothetical protein
MVDVDPWGDPGSCPFCGVKWQHVRPGKSQPNCDCQDYCFECGTKIKYYGEEDSPAEGIIGYLCKCMIEHFGGIYKEE